MSINNNFFTLSKAKQSQIFRDVASKLGFKPVIVEKDYWVCWALQQLFSMELPAAIVFKGGTSLSKVYNLIERFSEDIDVTFDYRGFEKLNGPLENQSRSFYKKFSKELKECVCNCVSEIVLPKFQNAALCVSKDINCSVDKSNGEKLRIYYPSVLTTLSTYINESVVIEFGGRNSIEPSEVNVVRPYIADFFRDWELPMAKGNVLSPMRTFWEKATLIHVECHRERIAAKTNCGGSVLLENDGRFQLEEKGSLLLEEQLNHLSRHWYDLAVLADSSFGKEALLNKDLLRDVIKYQKIFYYSGYANYDKCLNKQFQLVPNDSEIVALEQDFKAMVAERMFGDKQPVFDEIIARIQTLEKQLNE